MWYCTYAPIVDIYGCAVELEGVGVTVAPGLSRSDEHDEELLGLIACGIATKEGPLPLGANPSTSGFSALKVSPNKPFRLERSPSNAQR